jgi:hypothetical protein
MYASVGALFFPSSCIAMDAVTVKSTVRLAQSKNGTKDTGLSLLTVYPLKPVN